MRSTLGNPESRGPGFSLSAQGLLCEAGRGNCPEPNEVKISGNFSWVFGAMTFVYLRLNFSVLKIGHVNICLMPLGLGLNEHIFAW